jgi:hypothetical protein
MSNVAPPDDVQELPQLQGHTIGFVDTQAECEAMTLALNQAGFSNAAITVLHGEVEVPLLESLMDGSSWGESAEEVLKQGTLELRSGHSVVCIEVQNAEEAATVAAVSTQCGVRSIYHFGIMVDTRLTK